MMLAQYSGGVLVPIASKTTAAWTLEEIMTLDKMPEGQSGKDNHPEVLLNWWKRLDVQDGDIFQLRGDQGASGTFTFKKGFASASWGGCVGLVWALSGDVKWTVKPKASKDESEAVGERVWGYRLGWTPRDQMLTTALAPEQVKAGAATLLANRETAEQALAAKTPYLGCDSLSEPPCKSSRTLAYTFDLEGDKVPEVLTSYQLRPQSGGKLIEARILLTMLPTGAKLIGRWDMNELRTGDEALPPRFVGMVDLTGDGRGELIFSRVANETENWDVFESVPDRPGQWKPLFKTEIEGC
jgi:hypothetical protein